VLGMLMPLDTKDAKLFKASLLPVFSTIPKSDRPRFLHSYFRGWLSVCFLTNEDSIKSACSAINGRLAMSSFVKEGRFNVVWGRLIPFSSRSFPPFGFVVTILIDR